MELLFADGTSHSYEQLGAGILSLLTPGGLDDPKEVEGKIVVAEDVTPAHVQELIDCMAQNAVSQAA